MKYFLSLAIIINTIFFGIISYYTVQSNKLAEKNFQVISKNLDSINVRLKSINLSLDDKLYGIISNLSKK